MKEQEVERYKSIQVMADIPWLKFTARHHLICTRCITLFPVANIDCLRAMHKYLRMRSAKLRNHLKAAKFSKEGNINSTSLVFTLMKEHFQRRRKLSFKVLWNWRQMIFMWFWKLQPLSLNRQHITMPKHNF